MLGSDDGVPSRSVRPIRSKVAPRTVGGWVNRLVGRDDGGDEAGDEFWFILVSFCSKTHLFINAFAKKNH